jgi:hypothetical protein
LNWKRVSLLVGLLAAFVALPLHAETSRWTEERANAWYQQQPWLVGSNYIPATAINELEMWQAGTFDPATIDKELGWAESLGMNTMRVFLHDLLWQQDAAGFQKRLDQFLTMAAKHHIRPVLVLFDSCWDPYPRLGLQHPPIPGVHNSGWVQSPGAAALADPQQYPRLKAYVEGVVGAYARDPRILAWDLWNEPDNGNSSSYGKVEIKNKAALVLALLPQVFAWAREANPRSFQPQRGSNDAGLRVGAGGESHAAVDQRHLAGRLVVAGNPDADDARSTGAVRRDFVPQLRLAGGV